jgi:hydrogenase small subunit
MTDITRRKFLEMGTKIAVVLGLSPALVPQVVEAMEQLASGTAPVLWLQAQSCSGCSVSFLDASYPGPAQVLTRYISLLFHQTISTATGQTGVDIINKSIDTGGYYLVVEGAIPAGMPKAAMMAHEPISEQIARAAEKADAIIALGTCASFGGIPAAEGNPTGAVSLPDFLKSEGISTPTIRIPGCPAHPDWLVGTIVHLLKFGMPELDSLARPKLFFGKNLHDQCARFSDYEKEHFAEKFGDEGCLFKLGCLGPVTKADCTTRLWNGGINTCIYAGGPCIGCASENFARAKNFPFYRKGEANGKES